MSDVRDRLATDAEVAAVIEAEAKATAGPWRDDIDEIKDEHYNTVVGLYESGGPYTPDHDLVMKDADRALITIARNTIRPICLRVQAQAKELTALREALGRAVCGACRGHGWEAPDAARPGVCLDCGGSGKPRVEEAK